MTERPVDVDCSVMEGGGSVIRLTSALSTITERPVRMYNIRAGRPQPGLRNQHLRSLELLAGLSGGTVENARLGSRDVVFRPGSAEEHDLEIRLDTAGSLGLVLQSLLIASLRTKEKRKVLIEGGATFGKHAPPLQYIQFVLLPLLRRMGYQAEINVLRHGFYPVGGARVNVTIDPCAGLSPLVMGERGEVESVDVISVASSSLKKPRVAERQVREARSMLGSSGYEVSSRVRYSEASCSGSGMVLVARTGGGCILGADGLGEKGKPAEEVASAGVNMLLDAIGSGACVDEHMSDQILPYMALAKGKSRISVPSLTSHARTNIHILESFLPARFAVDEKDGVTWIECSPD